jgi:L-threonylcarbamoyladenylate synthase
MKTKILKIHSQDIEFTSKTYEQTIIEYLSNPPDPIISDDIKEDLSLSAIKARTSPVVVPTETVYGLAANGFSNDAVEKIYKVKNRPADNPLILHISSLNMSPPIPSIYLPLISKYWPGPLTILVPIDGRVASLALGNKSVRTVAIRFPEHKTFRALISLAGVPLAAPSANISGKPSPTHFSHVMRDLEGKVEVIIMEDDEDSCCRFGVESTVVDGLQNPPVILRPGSITLEMIKNVEGFENVQVLSSIKNVDSTQPQLIPTTPGMKYLHYSPSCEVILINMEKKSTESIMNFLNGEIKDGKTYDRIGFIRISPDIILYKNRTILKKSVHLCISEYNVEIDCEKHCVVEYFVKDCDNPDIYARALFKALRYLDEEKFVDVILVESVSRKDSGLAIMNRLEKAASREME